MAVVWASDTAQPGSARGALALFAELEECQYAGIHIRHHRTVAGPGAHMMDQTQADADYMKKEQVPQRSASGRAPFRPWTEVLRKG